MFHGYSIRMVVRFDSAYAVTYEYVHIICCFDDK